ncbi:MAG: adenylate/guanylate cyclase domain-containing protein, partial [Gammaproteobacteria bacterium]|nr:adenylate/guanylate cyclase domain-containing protein [Gammaproteobacteria bacterium]
ANEAALRIESTNRLRAENFQLALEYGIALHVGDVSYGNIGTGNRLEFTVIGEAANRAARIESLCKVLEEPVLVSAEFVRCFEVDQFVSKGQYELRGIEGLQEVFGVA